MTIENGNPSTNSTGWAQGGAVYSDGALDLTNDVTLEHNSTLSGGGATQPVVIRGLCLQPADRDPVGADRSGQPSDGLLLPDREDQGLRAGDAGPAHWRATDKCGATGYEGVSPHRRRPSSRPRIATARCRTLVGRGCVRSHSSLVGRRPARRAASTHSVCAWRRRCESPSGAISMCSLSAGRWDPHSGQRYVAGFRFCARRIIHQRTGCLLPIDRKSTRLNSSHW
jgi:hypothetical protein